MAGGEHNHDYDAAYYDHDYKPIRVQARSSDPIRNYMQSLLRDGHNSHTFRSHKFRSVSNLQQLFHNA
jgi:hypothetical protein